MRKNIKQTQGVSNMPKAELPPTDDSIFAIMDDIKKRSDFIIDDIEKRADILNERINQANIDCEGIRKIYPKLKEVWNARCSI